MSENTIINSLIPILVALGSLWIAKKQIINTGVTQFRQQWIDNLRNTLSIFISKVEYILIQSDLDKHTDAYTEMCQAQYKVELLLNPNEDDHNKIISKLEEIRTKVYESNRDLYNIDLLIDDLLKISKVVLKREWAVVKKGK